MVDQQKILERLRIYFIGDSIVELKKYDFDHQGRLNVYTDVRPRDYRFPNNRLPFSFGKVEGTFNVQDSHLTTLEGCPISVTKDCLVNGNKLKNLIGAPHSVGGVFDITNIATLASLEGFPLEVSSVRFNWAPSLPLLRLLNAAKITVAYPGTDVYVRRNGHKAADILNRYAGQGEAGAFACGAELASAGLKENARW